MNSGLVNIRPLAEADLAELLELCAEHAAYERQRFERGEQELRWRDMILGREPRLRCWVAEDATGLVGFASCSTEAATWSASQYVHLDCLYLRPQARGSGLGRQLLRRVAATAEAVGSDHLQWQTPVWNHRAASFYRRLGATARHKLRFALGGTALADLLADRPTEPTAPDPEPGPDTYAPRQCRFLGIETWQDWQCKLYGITRGGAEISAEQADAARQAVRATLPTPGQGPGRFGLGFAILHAGTEANWLLVDWWTDGGILRQKMLAAPLDQASGFVAVSDPEITACVWELAVIDHERRAWIEAGMARPSAVDEGTYLGRVLEGDI
ncbi:MAG: GNAT family N-acetyltransferase [Acidobacteriota bacterium]